MTFMDLGDKVRTGIKADIARRVSENERFSISTDEWTSHSNQKYMVIELHLKNKEKHNLGLKRIYGSLPAEKCAEMIADAMHEYGLENKHIVCTAIDGAPVMKKCSRILDIPPQVCIAHGIHLPFTKNHSTVSLNSKISLNSIQTQKYYSNFFEYWTTFVAIMTALKLFFQKGWQQLIFL